MIMWITLKTITFTIISFSIFFNHSKCDWLDIYNQTDYSLYQDYIDYSESFTSNPLNIDDVLAEIEEKIDQGCNSSMLLILSEELTQILNNNTFERNFTQQSLITSIRIVDKMQEHSKILDEIQIKNFAENMFDSCGQVINADHTWTKIENTQLSVSMGSKILKYVQDMGFNLGCRNGTKQQTNYQIIKPNIVVKTFTLDYEMRTEFKVSGIDSSITFPAGIPKPELNEDCKFGTAVGSMFDKLSTYLTHDLDDNYQINSNIVAFSIQNTANSTPLPPNIPPVKIIVKHNKPLVFGDIVNCVFWDFNQMNWSSNGCYFQPINSNRKLSICECNHLTNFAALIDISGRETDTKVKDILTKVCCGLSIICLILTIAVLILCRALRNNRRNNITCNICICLLIVNLLVVFGMDSTQNNSLCQTVAAFLLYFILCSFSWMLIEGYHLYQMIILVFSHIGYLRSIYMYAIGYGAPLLIALSAMLGIGFTNLKETDSYFCWISSPSHPYRVWAVAGPATIAILSNGLIMCLALKEVFSSKFKKKLNKDFSSDSTNIREKLSQSFSWIKGCISLVVLLGITWISFVLYIHEFGNLFSYFFIILNGLQGVFIFIFQILLNDKTRFAFRKTCLKILMSSLYRAIHVFTFMCSKSFSRDKCSADHSSDSSNCDTNKSDVNDLTIASHLSQSISTDIIKSGSDTIRF